MTRASSGHRREIIIEREIRARSHAIVAVDIFVLTDDAGETVRCSQLGARWWTAIYFNFYLVLELGARWSFTFSFCFSSFFHSIVSRFGVGYVLVLTPVVVFFEPKNTQQAL